MAPKSNRVRLVPPPIAVEIVQIEEDLWRTSRAQDVPYPSRSFVLPGNPHSQQISNQSSVSTIKHEMCTPQRFKANRGCLGMFRLLMRRCVLITRLCVCRTGRCILARE